MCLLPDLRKQQVLALSQLAVKKQEVLEVLVWLYLSMTDQFRIDPQLKKASFIYQVVPAEKRDMIYNFTQLIKLPAQTLGILESYVAQELASFTIFDQKLRKELDPTYPNQL